MLAGRLGDRRRIEPRVAYVLPRKDTLVAELVAEDVAVTCLGRGRRGGALWPWRLRQLLVSQRVEVIHSHSPLVAVAARLVVRTLRRRDRPKLVATEHNVWASHRRLTAWCNEHTYRLDDAHLAVSEAVRASLPPRLQGDVTVVRQGVDLDAVRGHLGDRVAARRALSADADQIVIGTVANLRRNKGYPDLLAAAASVIAAGIDARFVSIGQGPLADELAALRDELDLADRFTFLGYRHDVAALAAGFDIFCLASHHEGLPIALLEALALGIPVVVTRVGGIPEVVSDGVEGSVVEPGRPDELARALVSLAANPADRADRSAAARAASDGFSITAAIAATEACYVELSVR